MNKPGTRSRNKQFKGGKSITCAPPPFKKKIPFLENELKFIQDFNYCSCIHFQEWDELIPDSNHLLDQRWHFVCSFIGPTLTNNVGPRSFCSSGRLNCQPLVWRWPNAFSPTSPAYTNVMPTILFQVSRWDNAGPTRVLATSIIDSLEKLDSNFLVVAPQLKIHRWCVVVVPTLGQQQYVHCWNLSFGSMLGQWRHVIYAMLPTTQQLQPLSNVDTTIACYPEWHVLLSYTLMYRKTQNNDFISKGSFYQWTRAKLVAKAMTGLPFE